MIEIRFATDDDLLRLRPDLDKIYPRTQTKTGEIIRNWDIQHGLAMEEMGRILRGMRSTAEPFEMGRLDPRSQERLRYPAACLALHYIFVAADNAADDMGFYFRWAKYYRDEGERILRMEANQLDYDTDRDGTVSEDEKNQPIVMRVVRG